MVIFTGKVMARAMGKKRTTHNNHLESNLAKRKETNPCVWCFFRISDEREIKHCKRKNLAGMKSIDVGYALNLH
jgi:hypothetical protein